MKILLIKKEKMSHPLFLFFDGISKGLYIKIFTKFHAYREYGDIYPSNSLKSLNSKIWKYKGTIYKLRVDNGNESARVLFSKTKNGDLIIIHAFLKSTRKTPKKEARQAITIYQSLQKLGTVTWDEKHH